MWLMHSLLNNKIKNKIKKRNKKKLIRMKKPKKLVFKF